MRYLIEAMFEVWETRQDTLDIPIYNIQLICGMHCYHSTLTSKAQQNSDKV